MDMDTMNTTLTLSLSLSTNLARSERLIRIAEEHGYRADHAPGGAAILHMPGIVIQTGEYVVDEELITSVCGMYDALGY